MTINILAIDDEQVCLEIIEFSLIKKGYNVIKIDSGEKALVFIDNSDNIDLILLDMMMPDIYGLQVLERIKAHHKLKHIPVILQTGTSNEEDIEFALSLGAVSSIKKPYKREDLVALVEGTLEKNNIKA